jgi:N6-L-threonylcarbamoyladenine synthase
MTAVLGIETSCDETSVAVVLDGKEIAVNEVVTQIDLHAEFGGVVPEIASRQHTEAISALAQHVMDGFGQPVDAVAYTNGPGLMGALMVGASFAKAFAYAKGIPAVPIHHIEGHIYSAFLGIDKPEFPLLILVVSGGHTQLILAKKEFDYSIIATTRDDAVGESFDKVARLLNLSYPGGPSIQAAAMDGNPKAFDFPRAFSKSDEMAFSYSGLKTAVLYAVKDNEDYLVADAAASFQAAAIDVLIEQTQRAINVTNSSHLIVAGGVAANRLLRDRIAEEIEIPVLIPSFELCTDNAAMIACAGFWRLRAGHIGELTDSPNPNLGL